MSNSDPRSDQPVIVVGAGLSGLAAAIGVAVKGRRAIVFEAGDMVGGAAAYSGGQVWIGANHVAAREGIEDDLERVETYVRAIAHGDPSLLDEAAMRRWLGAAPVAAKYWEEIGAIEWTVIPGLTDYHAECDGAFGVGRYLTNQPIDGRDLGEWQPKLRRSPHFPVGVSYDRIVEVGRRQAMLEQEHDGSDPLTFGTGVVAWFLRRALQEERIEVVVSHPVTELLTEADGAVVGVRAEGPGGPRTERGPVVLATSSYDWDPELVNDLLGIEPEDFGSVAPRSLKGDAIHLVRKVGGDIARIPPTSVPMLPGWPDADNEPGFTYGPEYALPGCITVDQSGRRFCDDSYWVSFVGRALAPGDRHLPCFMVWDELHHQKYGLANTEPGGAYPALVASARTLVELGAKLGIDGEQLTRTVERFNVHARNGEDPEFGRGTVPFVRKYAGDPSHEPNPLLGPLDQPPFFGMRIRIVGTGIGSSGVRIDSDGHVLTPDLDPIPGLYAIGSCAALLSSGSGYNSGFALGRGLTLAYLVANELTGAVSEVPDYQSAGSAGRAISRSPLHLC